MSRVVRQSKFRHVFGTGAKKEQYYDGMRITRSNWEGSTYCSVNPKFIALIVESAGGGAFVVLPIAKTGRVERDCPVVGGHKAAVLDLKWCPHHDEVIASSSEDCTVKIWQIPEDGLKENLEEPIVDLVFHQRKVGVIEWHPTASNILLSAGADLKVCLWDVGEGDRLAELTVKDILYSISFNMCGDKFVTSCKDKKIRVHDARTLEVLQEEQAHEGAKASQAVFLKDDRIFTSGFSKMSGRQFSIWAKEGEDHSLGSGDGPLTQDEIDSSNGVVSLFYDADTNIVYLVGKGDSVIRYLEIVDDEPYFYWLSMYSSNIPLRGAGFMPKRGMNVNTNEIARIFKLAQGTGNQGGYCEPISFTVPRKSEIYQEDIYPDTFSGEPSITAEEWFIEKKNSPPQLISMKEFFDDGCSKKSKVKASVLTAAKKKPAAKSSSPEQQKTAAISNGAAESKNVTDTPAAAAVSSEAITDLLNDIKRLKIIVMGHEKRIATLEGKTSAADMSDHKEALSGQSEEIRKSEMARVHELKGAITHLRQQLSEYESRLTALEERVFEFECAV